IKTPAQPCFTACDVSLTVSVIEQQPVPGIMRDVSTPAPTSASSSVERSSTDSEFASLVVPNGASTQFCESNHRQCAMNRSLSGERSALNGVTPGASTPRMRCLGNRILVSSIPASVVAAVPAATPSHMTRPPPEGLTYSFTLVSASRLCPSMLPASLRLHSPWRTSKRVTSNSFRSTTLSAETEKPPRYYAPG